MVPENHTEKARLEQELQAARSNSLTDTSEITGFIKSGGSLTKKISLAKDGKIISDGSACVMSAGEAGRIPITDVKQLAEIIGNLKPDQAIALGRLRDGVLDHVKVATKSRLNGAVRNDLIARTQDDIVYQKGRPAPVLFDLDQKGMPPEILAEIERRGGYFQTLCSIMPELRGGAHVTRRSTSTGLFNPKTGEKFSGSGGMHVYALVADGTDAERFLKALHDRCWLAGFGWMMVGAGGTTLERSIVDRSVGGPERLVFEGAPILVPPLKQDQTSRKPVATEGATLNTVTACPPLTIVEKAKLRELIAKAKHKIAPEAAKARAAFIDEQSKLIVERAGISLSEARKVVERQCRGVLLPALVLPFDDPDFAKCTVADVLADPIRSKALSTDAARR